MLRAKILHLTLFGSALIALASLPTANSFVTPSSPLCHQSALLLSTDDGYDGLGEYDPSEGIRPQREVLVGDPQLRVKEKERDVTSILRELAAIQQQGPQKYCILGTRHCSYLHQQIIELLCVSNCTGIENGIGMNSHLLAFFLLQ